MLQTGHLDSANQSSLNLNSHQELYQKALTGQTLVTPEAAPQTLEAFKTEWNKFYQARSALRNTDLALDKRKIINKSLKQAELDLTNLFRRTFQPNVLLHTSNGTIRINSIVAKDKSRFFEKSGSQIWMQSPPCSLNATSSAVPAYEAQAAAEAPLCYPAEYLTARQESKKSKCRGLVIIPGNIRYENLRDVVHYFYTGQLKLNIQNIVDVCCLADFFDSPELLDRCDTFLAAQAMQTQDNSSPDSTGLQNYWNLACNLPLPKTVLSCLKILLYTDSLPADIPPLPFNIESLDLSSQSKQTTNQTLDRLCRLAPGIQNLNLMNCDQITNEGFSRLIETYQKCLVGLNIGGLKAISKEAYRQLALLTNLKALFLNRLNDVDCNVIASLSALSLEKLTLYSFTYLGAPELQQIAGLSTLRVLDITGAAFLKNDELKSLEQMPRLEQLTLNLCSALTLRIREILQTFPALKKAETKNCPSIPAEFLAFEHKLSGLQTSYDS